MRKITLLPALLFCFLLPVAMANANVYENINPSFFTIENTNGKYDLYIDWGINSNTQDNYAYSLRLSWNKGWPGYNVDTRKRAYIFRDVPSGTYTLSLAVKEHNRWNEQYVHWSDIIVPTPGANIPINEHIRKECETIVISPKNVADKFVSFIKNIFGNKEQNTETVCHDVYFFKQVTAKFSTANGRKYDPREYIATQKESGHNNFTQNTKHTSKKNAVTGYERTDGMSKREFKRIYGVDWDDTEAGAFQKSRVRYDDYKRKGYAAPKEIYYVKTVDNTSQNNISLPKIKSEPLDVRVKSYKPKSYEQKECERNVGKKWDSIRGICIKKVSNFDLCNSSAGEFVPECNR